MFLAVVTKADRVTSGDVDGHRKWKNIFEGKTQRHILNLGYYAVRLPLDDERQRRISRQELTQIATGIFRSNAPWKDLQGPARRRLGVDALVRDISRLLMRVLSEA